MCAADVSSVKVALFILTAVTSSFAGVISSIRTWPPIQTGVGVIAMVVLGGTALTGGRGTILGTVLGILILRVMRNRIVPTGARSHLHIFIGAIILGMMALHSWLERRRHAGT
jgi:simple sugar transport system permease protein